MSSIERSKEMKKIAVCLALTTVIGVGAPAMAEVPEGVKKVGNAIAWPFRKLGEGMKAAGSKMKGAFKKDGPPASSSATPGQ
jgi:hypothetical protein